MVIVGNSPRETPTVIFCYNWECGLGIPCTVLLFVISCYNSMIVVFVWPAARPGLPAGAAQYYRQPGIIPRPEVLTHILVAVGGWAAEGGR